MTIDKLLANFERLAEAPNGIPKLREMILQLAVRGKLVPQDPNDELASELLKRIRAEKQRLIADGQVPKPRSSRSAEEASVEPPFAVPEGWNWSTLDAISSYIQRGKGPKYVEESSIPVVSQKCVQWRGFTMEPARFIDPDSLDKYGPERFLRTGDLLWNSTGTGTIGRINVYHHQAHGFERVVADSHLTVVRPVDVSSEFIRTFLASPDVQDGFEDRASGSTNQIELSTAAVRAQEIPVPPLAEQKRIVAKVEQLMTLCDDLEAKRQAKLTKQIALNRASLHVLTKPNGTSLATAWHRVRDHFDDLYTVPETVAELRKSILQLAVMGRLVPQDPNDEPASELLKKIQAEKQRLIKEGKIRKQKCLPPVESDEMPSKLPGCWLWTRLDELIVAGPKNGYSPKPVDFETPVKTLTLSAVTRGTFNESCFKYVDLEADAVEKYWLEDGDLLVQRSNTPSMLESPPCTEDQRSSSCSPI